MAGIAATIATCDGPSGSASGAGVIPRSGIGVDDVVSYTTASGAAFQIPESDVQRSAGMVGQKVLKFTASQGESG